MTTLRNASPPERHSPRARAARTLVRVSGLIHRALFDLAVSIGRRLGPPLAGRGGALAGLLAILLLIAGLAFVGTGAVWAVRETLPHRRALP